MQCVSSYTLLSDASIFFTMLDREFEENWLKVDKKKIHICAYILGIEKKIEK